MFLPIRAKLIILFFLVISLLLSIVGFVVFNFSKNILIDAAKDKLGLVAQIKAEHLLTSLEQMKNRVIDFSSDGFIQDSAAKIADGGDDVAEITKLLNQHLINNMMSLDSTIVGITVINKEGIIMSATDEKEIGHNEAEDDYFRKSLESVYLSDVLPLHHFQIGTPGVMVAAPLTARETGKPQELLGIIVNHISLATLNKLVTDELQKELQVVDSGGDLSFYLINRDQMVIAASEAQHSKQELILKQKINTAAVNACWQGKVFTGTYENYQGEPVVGSAICIPETGWKLIVETAQKDVLAPVGRMRNFYMAVSIGAIIIAFGLIVLISRTITGPIKILSATMRKARQGDLSQRVRVNSRDEIGVLAETFNQMTASLSELDKLKSQFINVVSHQLRTPLNGIKWNLEMILSGETGKISKEQEEFIRLTYKSNQNILEILQDLILALDIERKQIFLKKTEVDLADLIRSVLLSFNAEIKFKNIALEFRPPKQKLPIVSGDPVFLQKAIAKIVDNAVRYTQEGGKITVSADEKDGSVIITVKDTGVGIPTECQDKIFTKFFRGHNASVMHTDASGLGLFLAKTLIEAHSGKIWFESVEGNGSIFYVSLPAG